MLGIDTAVVILSKHVLLLLRIALHSRVPSLRHIRIHLVHEITLRPCSLLSLLLLRTQEPRDKLLHALGTHLYLSKLTEVQRELLRAHLSKVVRLKRLLLQRVVLQLVLLEACPQLILLQIAHAVDVLKRHLRLLE